MGLTRVISPHTTFVLPRITLLVLYIFSGKIVPIALPYHVFLNLLMANSVGQIKHSKVADRKWPSAIRYTYETSAQATPDLIAPALILGGIHSNSWSMHTKRDRVLQEKCRRDKSKHKLSTARFFRHHVEKLHD